MANIRKFKKGTRIKVSNNFWSYEFDCKCKYTDCKSTIIDLDHVKNLQKLRDKVGRLKPTSGYRCEKHNKAEGGVSRSRHKISDATDVTSKTKSPDEIADVAEELGFDGIGRYNTFTHIDSRGYKARWDFRKKKKK